MSWFIDRWTEGWVGGWMKRVYPPVLKARPLWSGSSSVKRRIRLDDFSRLPPALMFQVPRVRKSWLVIANGIREPSWHGRLSQLEGLLCSWLRIRKPVEPCCTGINKTWAQAGCPPVPVGKAHHYPNIPAEGRSFKQNKFRAGSATA